MTIQRNAEMVMLLILWSNLIYKAISPIHSYVFIEISQCKLSRWP